MNDRFKEIAAQATAWCEKNATGAPVAWEWEKKFAELIVQDCVQHVSAIMEYTDHEDVELQMVELKALRDARQVIKELYGLT